VAGRQNRNRHGLRDGQRAESSGFPGSHDLAVRFGGRGRGTVGVQPVHGYRRTDRERPGRGLSDHAERDAFLTEREVRLLRQSCRNRPTQPPPAPGKHLLKPVRRLIESVFDTLRGQSTSNSTAGAPSAASVLGSGNACSRSPARSGTTGPPTSPPPDP
jgi:hypothetical protein